MKAISFENLRLNKKENDNKYNIAFRLMKTINNNRNIMDTTIETIENKLSIINIKFEICRKNVNYDYMTSNRLLCKLCGMLLMIGPSMIMGHIINNEIYLVFDVAGIEKNIFTKTIRMRILFFLIEITKKENHKQKIRKIEIDINETNTLENMLKIMTYEVNKHFNYNYDIFRENYNIDKSITEEEDNIQKLKFFGNTYIRKEFNKNLKRKMISDKTIIKLNKPLINFLYDEK